MKKVAVVTLAAVVLLGMAAGIHEFWSPSTAHLRFKREDGRVTLSKYKDGGSFGIHVELAGGKEEVAFLDRRMVFRSPGSSIWEPKKGGLVYLGFDAMTAMKPLDLSSDVGREFERLLRFERGRWLVRTGYLGDDYREMLCEFEAAVGRTRRANQSLEPTTLLGTSAAEQPLVPSRVVAHL